MLENIPALIRIPYWTERGLDKDSL